MVIGWQDSGGETQGEGDVGRADLNDIKELLLMSSNTISRLVWRKTPGSALILPNDGVGAPVDASLFVFVQFITVVWQCIVHFTSRVINIMSFNEKKAELGLQGSDGTLELSREKPASQLMICALPTLTPSALNLNAE
ncbi:hypothetical protein PROFUN_15445 [Planoprotostelium fungivorum]|uniref:Uncharacterized protein n=1 Tax=Planoprotostelium fungivorum TaxID=1890364 RepID=A0A2P6MW32_9EUKA|nr:hypothetical protein PROFUN_15445 [Planoprotostelium fungivorum]